MKGLEGNGKAMDCEEEGWEFDFFLACKITTLLIFQEKRGRWPFHAIEKKWEKRAYFWLLILGLGLGWESMWEWSLNHLSSISAIQTVNPFKNPQIHAYCQLPEVFHHLPRSYFPCWDLLLLCKSSWRVGWAWRKEIESR